MVTVLRNVHAWREMADAPDRPRSSTRAERIRAASDLRRREHRADLSRAILDAATELFLAHGYEGFSLRQVAEQVGYAPTAIYRHVGDKDALLAEIAGRGFRRLGRALEEAVARAADPLARLRAAGDAYARWGLEHPVEYRLMFMQRHDLLFEERIREPRLAGDEAAGTADAFAVLGRAVHEAMGAGVLRRGDPRMTAQALWAVVHGVVSLAIAESSAFSADRVTAVLDLALTAALAGLGPSTAG